jgi:hypothetical protein
MGWGCEVAVVVHQQVSVVSQATLKIFALKLHFLLRIPVKFNIRHLKLISIVFRPSVSTMKSNVGRIRQIRHRFRSVDDSLIIL